MEFERISIIKLLTVVTLLMMFTSVSPVSSHGDIELIMVNGAMKAPDLCDTPSQSITIKVISADEFKYDKAEYKVEKSTCYTFTFSNPTGIEHDMNVDEVHDEIGMVHMHVVNATVGPNGDGSISQNVLMPNKDVTYKIYCTVTGHDASGMHADLVVGNGSSSNSLPGFGFYVITASMIGIVLVVRQRKLRL